MQDIGLLARSHNWCKNKDFLLRELRPCLIPQRKWDTIFQLSVVATALLVKPSLPVELLPSLALLVTLTFAIMYSSLKPSTLLAVLKPST